MKDKFPLAAIPTAKKYIKAVNKSSGSCVYRSDISGPRPHMIHFHAISIYHVFGLGLK